ncbi:MAG: sterol desaturase family protein [Sphingobacteriales bacterium]|nr:MAG: sterol desaturase family protein [Sphingobacteriales bacterium]
MQQAVQAFGVLVSINVIRYFVIAGLAFVLFYFVFAQKMVRNKIQQRKASRKELLREVLHSLQTTLVLAAVGVLILFTPLRQYTLVYDAADAYAWWWLPVSVFLSLVVHDTYFYWMHRALRHKVVFKYTHLVHHKSTNPSPWASYSFHFFEACTEGAVLLLLVFVLPMNAAGIGLFVLIGFIINVYGHLGYEIMPRWFRHSLLFEVVNTSVYHNMHHSKFKGNYGLYFRIWDRLLKTEHPDYVKEYDRIQATRFPIV